MRPCPICFWHRFSFALLICLSAHRTTWTLLWQSLRALLATWTLTGHGTRWSPLPDFSMIAVLVLCWGHLLSDSAVSLYKKGGHGKKSHLYYLFCSQSWDLVQQTQNYLKLLLHIINSDGRWLWAGFSEGSLFRCRSVQDAVSHAFLSLMISL